MRLGKEIERLRQRVHKLSIEKDPPTLRMVIVKDEETPQELSAWDLRVTVERKKDHESYQREKEWEAHNQRDSTASSRTTSTRYQE